MLDSLLQRERDHRRGADLATRTKSRRRWMDHAAMALKLLPWVHVEGRDVPRRSRPESSCRGGTASGWMFSRAMRCFRRNRFRSVPLFSRLPENVLARMVGRVLRQENIARQ